MASVAVHPPKTPVTKGSSGVAVATLPNICKMPPPPPPFCPTPLPNIGQSGKNPKGYSTTVKIERAIVAITGSSFDSVGDIASKATGGGVVSNNAEGPTKFISPGELSVKVHNKFVQYLGDQMLNNCGPPGAPPNSATMQGEVQAPTVVVPWEDVLKEIACKCDKQVKPNKQSTCRQLGTDKHDCCNKEVQKRKNKTGPGRQDQLAPERGYTNPNSPPVSQIKMSRFDSLKAGNKGSCWPDAVLLDEKGKPKQLFDFKFQCPAGTRTRKKKDGSWATCKGGAPVGWTVYKGGKTQRDKYLKLGDALGIDNTANPPKVVSNEGCK